MHPITKSLLTERIPQQDIGFVVPVEAIAGRVGPDYVRRLAELGHGTSVRDPAALDLALCAGAGKTPSDELPEIVRAMDNAKGKTLLLLITCACMRNVLDQNSASKRPYW